MGHGEAQKHNGKKEAIGHGERQKRGEEHRLGACQHSRAAVQNSRARQMCSEEGAAKSFSAEHQWEAAVGSTSQSQQSEAAMQSSSGT